MQATNDTTFLRQVLLADAATSGAMALLLLLGAGLIERWMALPASTLRGAGLILLPFAALVAFLATRPRLPTPAVWAVILVNLAWAAESVVLASGWVDPADCAGPSLRARSGRRGGWICRRRVGRHAATVGQRCLRLGAGRHPGTALGDR